VYLTAICRTALDRNQLADIIRCQWKSDTPSRSGPQRPIVLQAPRLGCFLDPIHTRDVPRKGCICEFLHTVLEHRLDCLFNLAMSLRYSWSFMLTVLLLAIPSPTFSQTFRAGASAIDIAPETFPVRVNAMFTERSADAVVDPLYVKALALDDGDTLLVLCVVDTCMIPRELVDKAKADATRLTGVPTERMLVCATHTHSAPSAMGCLGSRVDPRYSAFLPGRITAAIVAAINNLSPTRVGWAQEDAWDLTFNRRWIRRSDRMFADPFGAVTVRAHMHPGHESPDAIGPSGPVDPQLSVLAVHHMDGRPLALLANFSMHYYGSPLLSSDYFGRFEHHLVTKLKAEPSFVSLFSQGTSGDLMWMDYGAPAQDIGYDAYALEMAGRAANLIAGITWQDHVHLQMAESKVQLNYRVPDQERLAWAQNVVDSVGDRLPQTLPEIYAMEALHLSVRPQTELIVQALRIGDLGITALPNEVFALTGLKLKRFSPFPATFNISLANGAEGYIPPPEQHALGGYTTWPARTAGLEPHAEPLLVEAALRLLEQIAEKPRRSAEEEAGPYARTVLEAEPLAYWRLEEMTLPTAQNSVGDTFHATLEPGVALFLPGVDGRFGHRTPQPTGHEAFSNEQIHRAVHFAGGRLRAELPLTETYSVEFWFWNGFPADVRPVTGYLYSRGPDANPSAVGEHLGIGGTHRSDLAGRLFLFNGNDRQDILGGRTTLALHAWHHVVLVRDGLNVRVHLDGRAEPEIDGTFAHTVPMNSNSLFLGGRNDGLFGFEGKLDEIAIYPRALSVEEITAHYQASALTPPTRITPLAAIEPPLSPEDSLQTIHVPDGYQAQLMAAEPLTVDPVAIDWDSAGRLWVVEMSDYPLGMDGKGQWGGRIRILEDTNGDNRYDQSSVFVDGLSFPTGLITWRDGVIVTAAPEVLFLRDTNGDGKADESTVLIRGLTTGNQQLRANGLRWGLDGWVYCAAGGHHGNYGADTKLWTKAGEFAVGARDFRFKPDTGELEPQSGPSQFGRNRDDWGRWFGTQNSRALWHFVLPDEYIRRNPHLAVPDTTHLVVTPLNAPVRPASSPEKRFHSYDNSGHFTSACSGMIYRDDWLYPRQDSFQHGFTCEPFHNLVQHNLIFHDDVSFRAERDPSDGSYDFFASTDRWCRPVMTRTGPDGALWVVDMYRYIIEHPDWLPESGKEELLPNYRLGDDRGRIYRVVPTKPAARSRHSQPRFDQLTPSDWVDLLPSPNGWVRDKAHMLLTWLPTPDPSVVGQVKELLTPHSSALARVHALWLLNQWNALSSDDLILALHDVHPGVRENALRISETRIEPRLIEAAAKRVLDPDPKVRLQAAFSLGEWASPVAGRALAQLAGNHPDSPFLRAAILSSVTPHLQPLVEGMFTQQNALATSWASLLTEQALVHDDRESLTLLLTSAFTEPTHGFRTEHFQIAEQILAVIQRRAGGLKEYLSRHEPLADTFSNALVQGPRSVFAVARKVVVDDLASLESRVAAVQLLAWDQAQPGEALKLLVALLHPQHPNELQRAALAALSRLSPASASSIIFDSWESFSPNTQSAAMEILLSREPWMVELLEQHRAGQIQGLTPDTTQRARLLQHGSRRVRDLAAEVLTMPSSRSDVIAQYQPALKLSGDRESGRNIFNTLCISCHALNGVGGLIGPDLVSVSGHEPDKLLSNILDPNADIQPGYTAYFVELQNGSDLYGVITSDTGHGLTLKLSDGTQQTILRKDIKQLRNTQQSMMPEGLESGLSHQDLADLIQFLRTGTKP